MRRVYRFDPMREALSVLIGYMLSRYVHGAETPKPDNRIIGYRVKITANVGVSLGYLGASGSVSRNDPSAFKHVFPTRTEAKVARARYLSLPWRKHYKGKLVRVVRKANPQVPPAESAPPERPVAG